MKTIHQIFPEADTGAMIDVDTCSTSDPRLWVGHCLPRRLLLDLPTAVRLRDVLNEFIAASSPAISEYKTKIIELPPGLYVPDLFMGNLTERLQALDEDGWEICGLLPFGTLPKLGVLYRKCSTGSNS